MNDDMSELLKNFSTMLNKQDMPDNIKNILNSMNKNNNINNNDSNSDSNSNSNSNFNTTNNINNNSNSSENVNSNTTTTNSQSSNTNNIFGDFDINTMLKMQKIMNSINNDKQNDSRTNLLMSLKPYLKDSRKNKVDKYIQLMKMGKIFEIINPLGGDNKNV